MDTTYSGKPLQTLSWDDKIKDKKAWFKQNVDFYISRSRFVHVDGRRGRDLDTLYSVYNNHFPLKWFDHVTDPLSAKIPAHKEFPAKIRPVSILRTNIDLLISEYPRRPFLYTVNNLDEGAYNSYLEELSNQMESALTDMFQRKLDAMMSPQQKAQEQQAEAQGQQPQDPVPEKIRDQFGTTYKDAIAIKGQRWLKRAVKEFFLQPKFIKMFRDWLIAGEAYSYKGLSHGYFKYERIDPREIDYVKAQDTDFIEDAEVQIVRRLMTVSDVVDEFYEELSKEDIVDMETSAAYRTPQTFYDSLSGMTTAENGGLVEVWHVCWKARKNVKILHSTDPQTGEETETEVDENHPVDKSMGEWVEDLWPNEFYEGWRIGRDKYVRMQPIPVQRNSMSNFSTCKGPYNGRQFSNVNNDNTSPLEIGIPLQIMHIITTRALELTIAKSKGKILLIDHKAIPHEGEWNDEKFFYYAEALGYGLLNRNQIGVDKSWNQYQVLDMSLFENIKQLIELQDHFKQEWDDVLGINRQRKGQTYASDLVGVNERATFQSTVITDMIFNLFEEFTERELQGILDFSKFINVDGVRAMYNDDVLGAQLLEIDPNTYCNADLGVMVDSSAEAIAMKNKVESTVTAMIQNNVKPSSVVAIYKQQNIAELEQQLRKIEQLEAEMQQQELQTEEQNAQAADERKMRFAKYENMLKTDYMNEEYNRKEDLEMIVADANTYTFKNGDSNNNGVPDIMEIEQHKLDREKFEAGVQQQNADRAQRTQSDNAKLAMKDKELKMKEIQSKRQARAKARSTSKP